MRLPIRWKLLLSIGVPLVVIYSVMLVLAYESLRKRGYLEMEIELTRLAADQAAELDGLFRTYAQVGLSTASFLSLSPDLSEQQLYDLLTANVNQDPLIYGACIAFEPHTFDERRLFAPYVYRRAGGLASMDVGRDAYDYTDPKWEWFHCPRRTGKAFWTEPFFDEGAGDIIMCTHVTPFFRDGKFRGTSNIDIPITQLQEQFAEMESAADSFMIISASGTYISHENPALIMHQTILGRADELKLPELAELGRKMLAGQRGTMRIDAMRNHDPQWMFFAPIPSTGWSLCAMMSEGKVMAFANQQLAIGISAMLLGLVLITTMLFIVASRLTRPIDRLHGAVKMLGEGRLEAPDLDVSRSDEIGDLARAFNQMIADLRGNIAALTKATAQREAVESELRVARNIQASLLPRTFPPFPHRKEFDLHAINAAARHVAGDFFDFLFVNDDTLLFVIADVSGKGVPAAMMMAVSRTLFRNLASQTTSPSELLTRTNSILLQDNTETMFVTAFLGLYEVRTGRLRYANAGHPHPILVHPDGRTERFGLITGTVLGVVEGLEYDDAEATLQPGQRLVLYTDGVTEARSRISREFYHESRLTDLLARHAKEPIDRLCKIISDELEVFQEHELSDDVTLLILQRNR